MSPVSAAVSTSSGPICPRYSRSRCAYAFVVGNDLVDRRAVKTGGADGDRIEVLAGLNPGERVVVSPPPGLTSGTRVTVK